MDEMADPFTGTVKVTISRLRASWVIPRSSRRSPRLATGFRDPWCAFLPCSAARWLPWRTVRLRLTLLYGVVWSRAATTYLLVTNKIFGAEAVFEIHDAGGPLPAGAGARAEHPLP